LIVLYERHCAPACEQVRLALNYLGLPWAALRMDAKRAAHLRRQPGPWPQLTVPVLHDEARGVWVTEATPILRYLAATYRGRPPLFPGDAVNRAAVDAKLQEFDRQLGPAAWRFAATQVILECPALLAELCLGPRWWCRGPLQRWAGELIGMRLTRRFAFHRTEALGLYEALEDYLLQQAGALEGRRYVVGEHFSAADLALAAQLRPLAIVPFFAEHPGLRSLFARQFRVLTELGEQDELRYQRAIAAARRRRPAYRRYLRPVPSPAKRVPEPRRNWGALAMPYHYWIGLRRNAVRQAEASERVR